LPSETPSPEAPKPPPQPPEEPALEPPPAPVESVPSRPETGDESQPKATEPHAAKTIDANKLLAGIKKLSLRFRSTERDPKNTLNLTIKRQALDALEQLDIEVEEKDPPVMMIDIKISGAADPFTVVISAVVGCPVPGGKLVAVWKQRKQVVSIPAQRLRQDQILRVLRIGAKDFFDRFVEDVRKARNKVKFD